MAISLDELLRAKPKVMPYLCYPLLPAGGRMVIGGAPKTFKSMLSMLMAFSFAEGQKVLGVWQVPRPMKVLIIEQEIGEFRLTERARVMQMVLNGEYSPYNMFFQSKDLTINLDTAQGLGKLKQEIDSVEPDVLVLDPLRKLHHAKESDSDQMVNIFHNLDEFQRGSNMGVIIVHHTSKRSEFRNSQDPESLRGSGEIFADVDTALMVDRPTQNVKELLRLSFTLRSAADPPPMTVRFNPETFEFRINEMRGRE